MNINRMLGRLGSPPNSQQLCRRLVSTISSRFNSLPVSQRFSLQFTLKDKKGLFEIPELTNPHGFQILKERVKNEANELLEEATNPNRKRKMVQVFDELSDTLCRVADMADFVRVAHPKVKYREAAEDACIAVSTVVQQMNTNTDLYKAIKTVVEHDDTLSAHATTDIDKTVAKLFLDDFEKCGIHLDDTKRKRFVQLSEDIMMLETYFTQGTHHSATITKADLPVHLQYLFGTSNQLQLNSMNSEHTEEDVREAAYRGYLLPNEQQQKLLDLLLSSRDELAKLTGYRSYAERALEGTMTETPEKAQAFLQILSEGIMPLAKKDFKLLELIKNSGTNKKSQLKPWDVAYYSALARRHSIGVNISDISAYLSLGACMNGLSLLVEQLYGVTLEVVTPDPSEIWHDSVYKLKVKWLNSEELIGYIYCDFFERLEKPNQDCHFTIQCGRRKETGEYQIPKVVLMMNFSPPTALKPTLLTPQQLDNLFHEFGHAMHSMLGRTTYQHVSGTRCSTDFAEVPSILMEYFSSDYRVLSRFTSHYKTGDPMPESIAQQMIRSKAMFSASDTQLQIFYSALDQRLHSQHPLGHSSTEILSKIQDEFYSLPYVQNTAWHLRFGHLVGYGAKYFSYLMSRAIAANIWQKCFSDDPLNRVSGERYMNEVLIHGGQKPPALMIESLLGTKPTIENLANSLVKETTAGGNY